MLQIHFGMNGGISFRVGLILYIARKRSSLSRKYSNTYDVIFFSLKLINFLNCCFKKSRYRLAVAPESLNRFKRFLFLDKDEMVWGGRLYALNKSCSFCHQSIILLFLPLPEPKPPPSLMEMFAYAASPASVCKTSSTCRLRHHKSMSMSGSGRPKMMLPPIDSEGDNFKAM